MKLLFVVILAQFALVSPSPAQTVPDYDDLLKQMSDRQLIECLRDKPTTCPIPDQDRDLGWIAGTLGQRKHPGALISAYTTADTYQRYYLVRALSMINKPKVTDFMRSIAFENLPEGQDNDDVFFPLDYLARHCDQRALARLNRRVNFDKSFPMGCIYFAPTVAAFGRCNYRAAAPNLVLALDAACLNIVGAADEGLRKFFPGACKHMKSPEEEQRCYNNLIEDHHNPQFPLTTNH
jgi:hypothetical protein